METTAQTGSVRSLTEEEAAAYRAALAEGQRTSQRVIDAWAKTRRDGAAAVIDLTDMGKREAIRSNS